MKKIVYFIPAILIVLFGLFLPMMGLAAGAFWLVWLALFVIGGILLARGKIWGSFIGMLPGIHQMYMSTQDTGQAINIEFPMGILITTFYLLCFLFLFFRNRKK